MEDMNMTCYYDMLRMEIYEFMSIVMYETLSELVAAGRSSELELELETQQQL